MALAVIADVARALADPHTMSILEKYLSGRIVTSVLLPQITSRSKDIQVRLIPSTIKRHRQAARLKPQILSPALQHCDNRRHGIVAYLGQQHAQVLL